MKLKQTLRDIIREEVSKALSVNELRWGENPEDRKYIPTITNPIGKTLISDLVKLPIWKKLQMFFGHKGIKTVKNKGEVGFNVTLHFVNAPSSVYGQDILPADLQKQLQNRYKVIARSGAHGKNGWINLTFIPQAV